MEKNKIKLFDAFTGYGGASWGLNKALWLEKYINRVWYDMV